MGRPGTRAHVRDATMHNATYVQKGHFAFLRRLPVSSYSFWKEGLLVHYLLAKWSNYNRLHTLEPYLRSATNGSAHKTADLRLAHAQLSRFQVSSRWNVTHVHSCARPSRFLCVTLKNLEGLGTRLCRVHVCALENTRQQWKVPSTHNTWKLKP